MSENLTKRTLRGVSWSFLERGGSQLISTLVSLMLARLLSPEDFGLIAVILVFTNLSVVIVDAGFSSAIIQRRTTTHIDESSVFYFNMMLSILVATIIYFVMPFISGFYREPLITSLGRVLSLNIILAGIASIQVALLTKRLDFRSQVVVGLISTVASGTLGILMALQGNGVWSLVAQSISYNVLRSGLLWFVAKWRPRLAFSVSSLTSMFPFGSRLLVSGLLNTLFSNLVPLIIGKAHSVTELGYYSRANQLQSVPVYSLTSAITTVLFPVFSSVQDDKERLKRAVRKALTSISFAVLPMMFGLVVVAKPLILVILTEKWLPSYQYLQLLCVLGVLFPLHSVNLNVLKALGRSDLFLRLEILNKMIFVGAILVTYRFGIFAMIWGMIVSSLIAYCLNSLYTGKLLGYTMWDQLRDLMPNILIALVMAVCIYPLEFFVLQNSIALLALQVVLGAIVYIWVCSLMQLRAFLDLWEMIGGQRFLNLRKTSA